MNKIFAVRALSQGVVTLPTFLTGLFSTVRKSWPNPVLFLCCQVQVCLSRQQVMHTRQLFLIIPGCLPARLQPELHLQRAACSVRRPTVHSEAFDWNTLRPGSCPATFRGDRHWSESRFSPSRRPKWGQAAALVQREALRLWTVDISLSVWQLHRAEGLQATSKSSFPSCAASCTTLCCGENKKESLEPVHEPQLTIYVKRHKVTERAQISAQFFITNYWDCITHIEP